MNLDKSFLKLKIGIFFVIFLLIAPHVLFILMIYILPQEGKIVLNKFLLPKSHFTYFIGIIFLVICSMIAACLIIWTYKIWMEIEYSRKGKFVPGRDDFWGIVKHFKKYPLPSLFLILAVMTCYCINLWLVRYIWPKIGGIRF